MQAVEDGTLEEMEEAKKRKRKKKVLDPTVEDPTSSSKVYT